MSQLITSNPSLLSSGKYANVLYSPAQSTQQQTLPWFCTQTNCRYSTASSDKLQQQTLEICAIYCLDFCALYCSMAPQKSVVGTSINAAHNLGVCAPLLTQKRCPLHCCMDIFNPATNFWVCMPFFPPWNASTSSPCSALPLKPLS